MSTAPRRLPRLATGLLLAVALAGCRDGSILRPRFPQVEQAQEAVHGGGERYRDHQRCFQASKTVDDLVRCMDEAHWHFVERGAVFPGPECWEAREHGELERIAPHCFMRAPEHP